MGLLFEDCLVISRGICAKYAWGEKLVGVVFGLLKKLTTKMISNDTPSVGQTNTIHPLLYTIYAVCYFTKERDTF